MRWNKKPPVKSDKTQTIRSQKRGVVGYSRKTALLEEAITQMNAGKYGRSSAALKELLALDPTNMEARRLFATLHLRLGNLLPAKHAFDSLIDEAFQRQDYWLAESLLREYLATAQRCVPFLEKLGSIYQEKGDALEAAIEYGKAIDILIEDPDPENPQHASQLYAKIRDLAPVSPVAFRLASFFDAQTGELLPRQPTESTEPFSPPTLDASTENSDGEAPSGPINGTMPWELPNPNGVDTLSSSPSPAASPDVSGKEGLSPEDSRLSMDSQYPSQTKDEISDVRAEISEETRTPEIAAMPSGATIGGPAGKSTSEDVLSEVLGQDLVGAVSTTQGEDDPVLRRGAEVSLQGQGSVLGEIQQEVLIDAVAPSEPPGDTDLTKALESSDDTAIQASDIDATVSVQAKGDSSSTLSVAEPVSVEITESQDTTTSFSQPVETESQELTATQPSGVSDSSTEAPVLNETSEPRPLPGFSWKSVFTSPWKSESHDSENVAQQEEAPSIEERIAEASTVSPSQESPSRSPFVGSREDDPQPTYKDGSSPGHRIAPMPWDHVQESDISINPAQLESPKEESKDLTADQPADEARLDWTRKAEPTDEQAPPLGITSPEVDSFLVARDSETPQLSDSPSLRENNRTTAERDEVQSAPSFQLSTNSQETDSFAIIQDSDVLQPPDAAPLLEGEHAADTGETRPSIPIECNTTSQEADSFSIVQDSDVPNPQDTPILREVDHPVAEVGPPSSSTQEEAAFLKLEPQDPLSISSVLDEVPVPEAQNTGVAQPQLREEPIADDQASVQGEVHVPSIDSLVRLEDESISTDLHLSAQKDSVEAPWRPAQHTDETTSGTTGESPSFPYSDSAAPSAVPSTGTKQTVWAPEPEISVTPSAATEAIENQSQKIQPTKEVLVEARSPILEPVSHQEEWQKAGESIRFIEEPQPAPTAKVPPSIAEPQEQSPPLSAAASAVEVLFGSSPDLRKTEARQRAAEATSHEKRGSFLSPIRTAIAGFLRTCFSTTRAIVATCIGLMVLSVVAVALGIGAIGLVWIMLEEPSSPAFQSLTTTPQRTDLDSKKNGYLLLLGIDAAAGQDPVQSGHERSPGAVDAKAALTCFGSVGSRTAERSNASADVMRGWFRGSNPIGQFKSRQATIKGWVQEHQLTLNRYGQWQKLPFEDWGYGKPSSPPCVTMAFAHQLHVADGFLQSSDLGVDRLETDMEAWRIVLSQARTLPVKMLALQAINDDIAVASGLLVQSDFESTHLGRVTKLLRPLDQGELSLRWPMQSELVAASNTYEEQLKAAQAEDQAAFITVASHLPLPKQRRLNDYAKYYEASYKAAGEGQYGSLPKWKNYIHVPASGFMDYLTNPIENIVGLEPLPSWDLYNGFVVDTDAHLRLASLQAWLRRGPADSDLLVRIAKAGQNFYDPYTGLPMLVNMKKGVFYSVGYDGKDQDGDPELDVVAEIPIGQTTTTSTKSATGSSKAK